MGETETQWLQVPSTKYQETFIESHSHTKGTIFHTMVFKDLWNWVVSFFMDLIIVVKNYSFSEMQCSLMIMIELGHGLDALRQGLGVLAKNQA